MTDVSEQTLTLAEQLALRGRKRLACAKNAIAWALFGTEDEEEITISTEEGIACERAAIRSLTDLKDAGLLDNEPLLGLATTRELLQELEARGRSDTPIDTFDPNGWLHYYAVKALEDVPPEALDYATKSPKDVADDYGTINNSDDAVEKEVTQ